MLPVYSQLIFCEMVPPQHPPHIRGEGTRASLLSPLLARSMASLWGAGEAFVVLGHLCLLCPLRLLKTRPALSDSVVFSLGLSSVCACHLRLCLPPSESLQAL